MSTGKVNAIGLLFGMVALGVYAVVAGGTDGIATAPFMLFMITMFGMIGVVIDHVWDSTILRVLWGAAFGATIGISVSSGTWFEVLFVALLGIFLAMIGTHVIDQWVADSSPEPATAN